MPKKMSWIMECHNNAEAENHIEERSDESLVMLKQGKEPEEFKNQQ
jgi:hypothetical protein